MTAPISVERLRELLAVSSLRLPLCQFGAHVDGADGDTVADCYYNAAHEQDGRDVAELFAAAVNALPALLHQLDETKGQSDRLCGKYLAALSRAEAAESKLAERDAEVERLRRECDLRKHAVDRWVPCPDHRDKTDGRCYVCASEAAERARDEVERNAARYRWLRDSKDLDGPRITTWDKTIGEPLYPSPTLADALIDAARAVPAQGGVDRD